MGDGGGVEGGGGSKKEDSGRCLLGRWAKAVANSITHRGTGIAGGAGTPSRVVAAIESVAQFVTAVAGDFATVPLYARDRPRQFTKLPSRTVSRSRSAALSSGLGLLMMPTGRVRNLNRVIRRKISRPAEIKGKF